MILVAWQLYKQRMQGGHSIDTILFYMKIIHIFQVTTLPIRNRPRYNTSGKPIIVLVVTPMCNMIIYSFSLACNSACNEGSMRCHGLADSACCPYYSGNMCVATCPNDLEPDGDFDCNCTGFFVGPPTCQGNAV